MNRRNFIQSLASSTFGVALLQNNITFAQDINEVTVVQLVNFMCGNSRQVNVQFDRMAMATKAANVGFRFAPVTWDSQSPWPARIYYTIRNLYPAAEPVIRNALFDGMQARGMAFETMSQVMAHLVNSQIDVEATKLEPQFNLATIAAASTSEDIEVSMLRAARLLILSEAQFVPTFVWLKDGEIIKTLAGEAAPNPPALVSLFVKTVTTPAS